MKVIIIASQNPVKTRAALNGFQRMFPHQAFELQSAPAASGVSAQPRSDSETLQGACNRALAAAQAYPQADYWVGIEGGVEDCGEQMTAFAWVAVMDRQQTGQGRTGAFFLPPAIAALIRQGKELGDADDIVFGQSNSKQKNGAIGLLTGNVIDRQALYEQAVILALLPFKNPTLY